MPQWNESRLLREGLTYRSDVSKLQRVENTHRWSFILDGFSRHSSPVMNGRWHCALHSDKSCKALCLMALQRRCRGWTIHQRSCAHHCLWEDHTPVVHCGASPVLYPSRTRSPFSFTSDLLPSLLSSPSICLLLLSLLLSTATLPFTCVFNSPFTYPPNFKVYAATSLKMGPTG